MNKNGIYLANGETPLTFQVQPGVGLKGENVEFLLGMPLNQVITMIQQNARTIQQVHLRYSQKNPFGPDICIYLKNHGISLIFDATLQLLKLIEIDNSSKIVLKYGKAIFSEPGAEASLEKIDEYFGSTHPGAYDDKQKMYVQSWPGLSVCFPTDATTCNVQIQPGFPPNLRSLKYDTNSQPRLTKMSIYQGKELSQPELVDIPPSCYCGQNRTRLVEGIWNEKNNLIGLEIIFDTQTGEIVEGEFKVEQVKRELYFGDSVAAVQSILGAPSKVFYKSDDKMKIHRGASKETLVGMPHFFFNYFTMGLDVLFDFVTKRVIKFVLHTNAPGHPDFGIYSSCNFSISVHESKYEIKTHSKFDDLAFCDQNLDFSGPPVVLQRHDQSPFESTFCYGIHQIVVEVMQNGHIAAVTLYDENL